MKLQTSFSHIFDKGEQFSVFTKTLIDYLQGYKVSFCFVPVPQKTGYLANSKNVKYIADLFSSTNYLYNTGNTAVVNPQVLTKGNLELQTTGLNRANFFALNRNRNVKSIFMVYRPISGNKFSMVRSFQAGDVIIYYDAFPSGKTQLFDLQTCYDRRRPDTNSATRILNARIEINNLSKPYTTNPAFGTPKLLTLTNINEMIGGFGNRVNASLTCSTDSSYPPDLIYTGGISFLLGVDDDLPDELREEINLFLMDYYLTYNGTILLDNTRLNYVVNQTVSTPLLARFYDEWFDITSLELIDPNYLGLSIINGNLVGTITQEFEGFLRIKVNTTGSSSFHLIPIRITEEDAIIQLLPQLNNVEGIFISRTGLSLNTSGTVDSWEDGRRNELYLNSSGTVLLNNDLSISILNNSKLLLNTSISGKTYVFIYKQSEYGNRQFTNNFPDILGNGVLWTVPNISDIFGTTIQTRFEVQIGRINIDLFRYILPLNEYFIIIGRSNEPLATSFLPANRGSLKLFAVWSEKLLDSEVAYLFTLLSEFLTTLKPQYIVRSPQKFQVPNIQLNLNTIISDPLNQTLNYQTNYPEIFIINNILSYTAIKDEILNVPIVVSNQSLQSTYNIVLNIQIKNNQLYLAFQQNSIVPDLFFITEDSLQFSTNSIIKWFEYSGKNNTLISETNNIELYSNLNFKNTGVNYGNSGNSYFRLSPSASLKSIFLVVYIVNTENISSWFGNNLIILAIFSNSVIVENVNIPTLQQVNLNGRNVNLNEKLQLGFNTLYLQYDELVNISSLSSDRNIPNRSMRGAIYFCATFKENQNPSILNKISRDYFDPIRELLILRFNQNIFNEAQVCQTNSNVFRFSTNTNRGNFSLVLNRSYLNFTNELFRTSYENFTVRFFINRRDNVSLQTIFTFDRLTLFIENNILILGEGLFNNSYGVTNLDTNYQFITISRYEDNIYFFYNTQLVKVTSTDNSYSSTSFLIGSTNLTSSEVLITEFVFIRRLGVSNVSAVPTFPYISL